MRRRQVIALTGLTALTLGFFALTGSYAWYLRSGWYRERCAALLSSYLELPASVGQVVPRSRTAREFRNVRVWLPGKRGEAAFCQSAFWRCAPTATDPEAYELDLRGGRCEVSTRTWLREDYRTVLESGLRPGFTPGGPQRVQFSRMDLTFVRDRFRLELDDAGGLIVFDQPARGRAAVTCQRLNGHTPARPVTLSAEFSPLTRGIRLERVELIVPNLPLAVVGLEQLFGLPVRSGTFSGRLEYREQVAGVTLALVGKATGISLEECTSGLFEPPWQGAAPEVELEQLTIVDGVPTRLAFHGTCTGLRLGQMLTACGLADCGGRTTLNVRHAELSTAGIERLVLSGSCEDLDLEVLSAASGWGRMSGRAQILIDDLTIERNRLRSLDAEISVGGQPGVDRWVERDLLSTVLRRTVGVPLPTFLPERFAYTRLGLRLQVRDEILYVFGTHGPREQTILSVSLADQEIPVVFEPTEPFDLQPALDSARAKLTEYVRRSWRELTARHGWPDPSQPATAPDFPAGLDPQRK